MARVGFDHVTKRFDGTVAVDDLSLEIAEGELLVLVGPSGCGKSTALRMLAGLEDVTEGRILIGDRVVNNISPASRDVAMVFQSYALYPHMTVYDNLAFGLRNFKVPKAEIDERVRNAAEILEMGDLLKRKPKQLSGGQRQRVALGRAIVREPVAFLMDEPLSNLDAALRVQTRAEIMRLQDRLGTTTIYVTHDQVEAMTMGDRIAVMRSGVLQQIGTPEELYTRPVNVFVARFIGSPAMNVVPASLVGGPGTSGQLVGFRPGAHRAAGPAGDGASFEADVEVVEYLGDEQLVHLRLGDVPVLAKLDVDQRAAAGRPRDLPRAGRPPAPVRRRDRAGSGANGRRGAVEPPRRSCGGKTKCGSGRFGSSISRRSASTAVCAISSIGCAIVVSRGSVQSEAMPSKPTTERSSGTRSPRRAASWRTPIAITSDEQITAVGGSAVPQQPRERLPAALDAELAEGDEPVRDEPRGEHRGLAPAGLQLGREVVLRPGDEADAPVAELDQVPRRELARGALVDADRRDVDAGRGRR